MKNTSPTAILLNLGHLIDHWVLGVYIYACVAIGLAWKTDWHDLTPFVYGASLMFGLGSIPAGRLGDLWGRRVMMIVFFAGMGVTSLLIAMCQNQWYIAAALTAMGAFASIYHPVGIPMLVQKAEKPGFTIGVNGVIGNLGVACAAGVTVYLAAHFGWQSAFIVPGVVSLLCAIAFPILVPFEPEAPAKRKQKMLALPPSVMARVFAVMTATAASGSVVFSITTNGNGELLRARMTSAAGNSDLLAILLIAVFVLASLAQLVVGKLIDRYPLKRIYLPIVILQVPLFILAAQLHEWALFVTVVAFMLFVFGAIPFTDAMIVRYVDDRMRSRVTGLRLAIATGIAAPATALLGPVVREAGFTTVLLVLAGFATVSTLAVLLLPDESEAFSAAAKPAE